MASIRGRKNDKAQDSTEAEVTDVNPESVESVKADESGEFDDLMASFEDDAVNKTAETEVDEMAKNAHDEIAEAEVVNEESVNAPTDEAKESALNDATKEIADRATGHTVEMLSVDSLPPTVPHIAMAIKGLDPIVELIKAATKEFEVNTSGSDAKIKNEIATLTEESDPEGFKKREAIAAAKAKIAELEEFIDTEEPKLYAAVEERLKEQGDVIWSEEVKDEKRNYITGMYAAYLSQHKGAEQFIEMHNKVAADANKVGTLDQYHVKLDKPFKRAGSSGGTGVRKSSGAPRNVSVSDARVSYDGGVNWKRAEGQLSPDGPVLSNPQFLAAEIARVSKESGNELKNRLYTEWYADNGSADGTPVPSDDVKDVSVFDFKYVAKDGSDAVAKVQLTKKGATIDA